MLAIGDIHVYVSDFNLALRFWVDGLGLSVVEKEVGGAIEYALLEFPDDGAAIRLFGGAEAWPDGARPPAGARPTMSFDLVTTDFNETLARLLEHGGEQMDEIETYDHLRIVSIADPDGNSFELVELPEEDSAKE